jgi:purine-nucleoside phosphorylase
MMGASTSDITNRAGARTSEGHPVAIVLGSGLGGLASKVTAKQRIAYRDIDGFPPDAEPVPGHAFEAIVGTLDGVPVVLYPGRVHLYQGFSAAQVTVLVRHAHRLGCREIVLTCASGAIRGNGSLGLATISDHINLTGANPLTDESVRDDLSSPFVGMAEAYSPCLRALAHEVADEAGIAVSEGVYAGVLGPSYETPAEVSALRTAGASYVGMSLVCETIMARALGMDVLGLTLATNFAAAPGLAHDEVLEDAARHAADFERLVRGVLRRL